MAVSAQLGMGAIPYVGGVGFRVWAKFASAVNVAGTFNNWSDTATPLTLEGNGYWSTDVPGAAVGDEYKFVITNPATVVPWKKDPYAHAMDVTKNGNSIIADTAFAWTAMNYSTPNWDEIVIYELHVGSFLFDPASPSGRGSFTTVIGKLPYLADLGINVIHVMPAAEFPSSYSAGYNPSDIFAIEVNYGGPKGFHALVEAAHALGIAVIFDVVYNHLGPNDLDLWVFDGWSQNNLGGIYFYNDARCATPWADTRPDYGRGEVRQFLRDNALFWLQQHQCDGLRFDATGWIRNVDGYNNDPNDDISDGWGLLQWINGEIQSRQPWKITIAEDMQDNEYITKNQGMGGAGFGSQMGCGICPHCTNGGEAAGRRCAQYYRARRRNRATLQPRRSAACGLQRKPRRGLLRERQCPVAGADLARQCRQLLCAETIHARSDARIYRTGHSDDLHGAGILDLGRLVGWRGARLVECRPLSWHH